MILLVEIIIFFVRISTIWPRNSVALAPMFVPGNGMMVGIARIMAINRAIVIVIARVLTHFYSISSLPSASASVAAVFLPPA